MLTKEETRRKAWVRRTLTSEVKTLISERLGFLNDPTFDPQLITDDQPLFGRGLELDSIDAAEIAVAIRERFDVHITDDNREVYGSINKLVDYIVEQNPAAEARF